MCPITYTLEQSGGAYSDTSPAGFLSLAADGTLTTNRDILGDKDNLKIKVNYNGVDLFTDMFHVKVICASGLTTKTIATVNRFYDIPTTLFASDQTELVIGDYV